MSLIAYLWLNYNCVMQDKLPQLDVAYRWLFQQRKHFPPNADIWHFRCHYPAIKSDLLQQVNSGDY
jgi:hypothetical protein